MENQNNDLYILQELVIGHLGRRYTEIGDLLEKTDPMSPEFLKLLEEQTDNMKKQLEFQRQYNKNIGIMDE